MPSMSRVRKFVARRASAKLAPTMPPPTTATSTSFMPGSSCRCGHQPLDGHGVLGNPGGQHFAAVARHDDVILDAYADALEFFRHSGRTRSDVDARFDGECHALL